MTSDGQIGFPGLKLYLFRAVRQLWIFKDVFGSFLFSIDFFIFT